MAWADAAGAVDKSVQQILLDRELQRLGVSPAQLAQRNQARQDEELNLRKQEMAQRQSQFDATTARQGRLDEEASQQHATTEATTLGDQLPPGLIMQPSDPAAAMMQKGGRGGLLTRNTTLPSMQTTGAALGDLTATQRPSDNQVQSLTKGASQKQIDTNTDNQRQQAQLDSAAADRSEARAERMQNANTAHEDRQATQASLDAYRQAMLQRQPQGRETFEEWKRKQDYAASIKPEKDVKLGQRDNDSVVTIHQMMPRINEVVADLEKATANQPKPKPGLLGAVSQVGQKVERIGQGAAYKMGLAQPSDVSNRIQLESLMQVLGSVPYLRGTRNYQFIQQIQQHLADPTATDAANLERLKQLQRILPEMEQAIYDVENKGVVPHEHGANYTGAAPAGGSGFSVREIK